jgi:hypothetical protein
MFQEVSDLSNTVCSVGCLLNKRADEQVELGLTAEGPEICPGPQKYGSFWLCGRPETRYFAEKCGIPLQWNSAPNHSLLEKVAASNIHQFI